LVPTKVKHQWPGFGVFVGVGATVGKGVGLGVELPPGVVVAVGPAVELPVADGEAFGPAVGEETTIVKKAAWGIEQGGTPALEKVTWIRTILLIAIGFKGMEKTANPSLVVIADSESVVPSGHSTVAEALALSTPSGLPFRLCTNLA